MEDKPKIGDKVKFKSGPNQPIQYRPIHTITGVNTKNGKYVVDVINDDVPNEPFFTYYYDCFERA